MTTTLLRVLSLGAGVQSTTLALMAMRGELPSPPDCSVFADTQAEPEDVYKHLKWLTGADYESWIDDKGRVRWRAISGVYTNGVMSIPTHVVTGGDLTEHVAAERPKGKYLKVDIPVYAKAADGSVGIINRSCTRDYKIDPIRRKVRELLGITGKRSPLEPVCEQWIGISWDEALRMKPSREPWQVMRWPLIERRMTRYDCHQWLDRHGYPEPPKSSCVFCPFHSDGQWRALKPEEMALAVDIDRRLRSRPPEAYRSTGVLYLHRSCKPLDEVDLTTLEDHGQMNFLNECEGICGV